jgi:3-phenylpropionate/trans-cinnamate dioxygenase ferredoxin subunit
MACPSGRQRNTEGYQEEVMTAFVRVAKLDEIPTGRARLVFVEGKAIALFKVEGEVYALDDSCPHLGSSLGMGRQDGAFVTCRAHGLCFDVRTGRMRGVNGLCAKTYGVQVVAGDISIDIDRPENKPPQADASAAPAPSARSCGSR